MTLTEGARLGPYEILAPLGAGGMGEVYKGRDTRLDRTVAVKVLPSHLSADPDRRARFEREARVISSLNHPHICMLHDVGREGDIDYIVMEHLEGETLAARLEKGALPLAKALGYGIEMADALDKAHRAGIVHRDLKPGNVILTSAGSKLLDFGLATRRGTGVFESRSPDGSSTPTIARPLTQAGTILGTVQYMAPEQLEGKEADARSDIFALGSLLYEMVTGRKAFEGKSHANLITAIMSVEPTALSSLDVKVPEPLERALAACLAKDPEKRWQSAGDLRRELEWIRDDGNRSVAVAPIKTRPWREVLFQVASVVFLLASLVLGTALYRRNLPEPATVRFLLLPPEGTTFTAAGATVPAANFALSPDGRHVAFVAAASDEPPLLWIRSLDSVAPRSLPGTEGAAYPFWSPDGRSLGFFTPDKLKRIEISGGAPEVLCEATLGRGGSWSRLGVIVFAPGAGESLFRVSASGGLPTAVTALERSNGESSHRFPQFLPDGSRFLFYVRGTPDVRGVYLGSLDGKLRRRLLVSEWAAAYARSEPGSNEPERLFFVKDGTLMAHSFDSSRIELVGEAVPVAQPVAGSSTSYAAFGVSDGGVLAYWSGASSPGQLTWFDRRGTEQSTLGSIVDYISFALSPNETALALAPVDPQLNTGDIWLLNLLRGVSSRITASPSSEAFPIWSPDGKRLVFRSDREGIGHLYQTASGGGGEEKLLFKSNENKVSTDWSADGRFILFHTSPAGTTTGWDIWALRVDDLTASPVIQTRFSEYQGRLSPDGRFIAYTSDESGRPEVYVRNFPVAEARWQISAEGGSEPLWRRDGNELFYIAAGGKLMSVGVKGGSTFASPQALFQTHLPTPSTPFRAYYVVRGDGQRFLVNTVVGEEKRAPITVVTHWRAEPGK